MSVREALNKIEFSISATLDDQHKGHEFFATLLWAMPIVIYESEDVKKLGAPSIAWTDGEKIYIVASAAEKVTPAELLFILEHELLHVLSDHLTRGKGKDPLIWNLATDAWINQTLVDAFGTVERDYFPGICPTEGAFFLESVQASKMSEEEIYDYLLKNAKITSKKIKLKLNSCPNCGGSGGSSEESEGKEQNQNQDQGSGNNSEEQQKQGQGDGNDGDQQGQQQQEEGNSSGQGQCDDEIEVEVVEVEIEGKKFTKVFADLKKGMQDAEENKTNPKETSEKLKNLARAVRDSIKSKGDLPGGLRELLDKLLKVKMPWDKILEHAIRNIMAKSESRTWAKPNLVMRSVAKKVGIAGFPGFGEELKSEHLVIVIDTSGSISQEELKKFLGVVYDSLQYFNKVTRIEHDADIHRVVEYEQEEFDSVIDSSFLEVHGGGGTSHEPVFRWIEEKFEEGEDISMVIFLTDYYSDCEEIKDKFAWVQYIPIVWVVTADLMPSYGITVKID